MSETDVLAEKMKKAVDEFCEMVPRVLLPVLENVGKAMMALYDAIESEYAKAGKPYGDSNEGMMKWVAEMGEIDRLLQRVMELRSMQRTCAELRAMANERRVQKAG